MSRRIAIVLVILVVLFLGGGLLLAYIQKARLNDHLMGSWNNLRQLSLFGAHHARPDEVPNPGKLVQEVPAGTIVLPGVSPEDRLSWIVYVLPGVDQRKNPTEALLARIDKAQPWTAQPNQEAGRTRLNLLLCPEQTPEVAPGSPAITCYVGIAGVGANAAAIPLPEMGPVDPRSGAFRYDSPTPFDRITDGLDQTLLMGETANEVGPWLRGGPSTTRAMLDAADAKPLIGGQFGGYFPSGANFALCSGAVRLFTPQTTPDVLLKMATIAGGAAGPIPGE